MAKKKIADTEESLGTRVKELRIRMGLTQTDVANALHVTPGYISNVENNRTAMSLRVLIYYAQLMHTTLDSLVGAMEPGYAPTALDNELSILLSRLKSEEKKKLAHTLALWFGS